MKISIHFIQTLRTFFILGITNLFIFAAVAIVLLSPHTVAHANASSCPRGWHADASNLGGCRPDGFCDTGAVLSYQNSVATCITEANNPNKCNPGATWQNPDDATECLPMSQPCGSASHFDSTLRFCVMSYNSVQDYINAHFAPEVTGQKPDGECPDQ